MARRNRDVAIIVLKCAFIGLYAGDRQAALGAEMVPADARSTLAQPDAQMVQETKNAEASAEPQAVMREIKSVSRLPRSKQRRRKPKMAVVPAGPQAVAQETEEPGSQAETGSQAVTVGPGAAVTVGSGAAATVGSGAAATVGSGVAAQVTEETGVPEEARAGTEPPAGLEAAGVVKKKYGRAPIKWGIRLSDTVVLEHHIQTFHLIDPACQSVVAVCGGGSSQSRGLTHTQTAELGASTYIMQPYIANLNGKLGVNSSKSSNSTLGLSGSYGPGVGIGNNESLRSNTLFGGGKLGLFSQSRFPFSISLNAADRRDDSGLATVANVAKQLNLNQSYRPLNSSSTYSLNYGKETDNVVPFYTVVTRVDARTHSAWRGDYSTRDYPGHRIKALATFKDKTSSESSNIRTDSFGVTDRYLPIDSLWSFDSSADLIQSTDKESISRYTQAYSRATWQPEDEDIPLFMDGDVRLFDSMNAFVGLPAQSTQSSQNLEGNVGATYTFSNHLTGRADGKASIWNNNGIMTTTTTQRGTVYYSPGAIKLWKDSLYSWNANGGGYNLTGPGNDTGITGGVGQGLFIPSTANMFGKKWQISSRINQSLDTSISRISGPTAVLSNSGQVAVSPYILAKSKGMYGGSVGANVSTRASFSVYDTSTFAKSSSHNQYYVLDLALIESGSAAYNRHGLNVSVSVSATQGTLGSSNNRSQGLGLVGGTSFSYNNPRVFGVRGLSYDGTLKISQNSGTYSSNGISAPNDPNLNNPQFPWSLDQSLKYKVGQNEILLKTLVSDRYGVKDASLWLLFRAWRSIGGNWR